MGLSLLFFLLESPYSVDIDPRRKTVRITLDLGNEACSTFERLKYVASALDHDQQECEAIQIQIDRMDSTGSCEARRRIGSGSHKSGAEKQMSTQTPISIGSRSYIGCRRYTNTGWTAAGPRRALRRLRTTARVIGYDMTARGTSGDAGQTQGFAPLAPGRVPEGGRA